MKSQLKISIKFHSVTLNSLNHHFSIIFPSEIEIVKSHTKTPIKHRGCERCSRRFPHCQLCGPEATGPDGVVVPWFLCLVRG